MQFIDLKSQHTENSNFMYDIIYFQSPEENDDEIEGDWEDEEDEDFDDQADDLREIRASDDLDEPDAEDKYDITNPDPDDDHLPDDDMQ